jgi:hypothetical protein
MAMRSEGMVQGPCLLAYSCISLSNCAYCSSFW